MLVITNLRCMLNHWWYGVSVEVSRIESPQLTVTCSEFMCLYKVQRSFFVLKAVMLCWSPVIFSVWKRSKTSSLIISLLLRNVYIHVYYFGYIHACVLKGIVHYPTQNNPLLCFHLFINDHKASYSIANEAPSSHVGPDWLTVVVLGVQEQGIFDSRRFEALTVNPTEQTVQLPARMAEFP